MTEVETFLGEVNEGGRNGWVRRGRNNWGDWEECGKTGEVERGQEKYREEPTTWRNVGEAGRKRRKKENKKKTKRIPK